MELLQGTVEFSLLLHESEQLFHFGKGILDNVKSASFTKEQRGSSRSASLGVVDLGGCSNTPALDLRVQPSSLADGREPLFRGVLAAHCC
jgi:hypothetical protein